MKIILAGSRHFTNYTLFAAKCDHYLQNVTDIEIVCGGAPGADSLGDRYAKERSYPITYFFADWVRHGNAAGPIRNRQMAEYSDALVLFWDGTSPGSKNMLEEAVSRGLKVREVKI